MLAAGDPALLAPLDRLAQLYHLLCAAGHRDALLLDLGEFRGFDYYDGVVFDVFASGVGAELGGGGRYDHLIGRFGRNLPSTGFALDVDHLFRAVEWPQADAEEARIEYVVAGPRRSARAVIDLANKLRQGRRRVVQAARQRNRADVGVERARGCTGARRESVDRRGGAGSRSGPCRPLREGWGSGCATERTSPPAGHEESVTCGVAGLRAIPSAPGSLEMKSMPGIDLSQPRLPPQNLEAEQSVLGAVLLDNQAMAKAMELIVEENFYRTAHRKIYRAMLELSESGEVIDHITLTERLKAQGELEAVGGAAYLAELVQIVPSSANIRYHSKIIRDKALLRELLNTSTEVLTRGYEGTAPIDELLDFAERSVFSIAQGKVGPVLQSNQCHHQGEPRSGR